MFQKNSAYPNFFLSIQFSTVTFYILKEYTTSHNKKLLNKNIKYPTEKINFTGNEITPNESIAKLAQFQLCHKEWDLIKAGLYSSIQPDKI